MDKSVLFKRMQIHSKLDLVPLIQSLESEPIIVTNFCEIFPDFSRSIFSKYSSLEKLKKVDSDDIVGLVSATTSGGGMPLKDALVVLETEGGYINGWEYGGVGGELDEVLSSISLIPKKFGVAGRMLDSVMRWIFISNKVASSGSDWHVDPIGSAAFMFMVSGEKKWFIGDSFVDTIGVGDFLLVPPGIPHRIENVGSGLNIAVTHNWVTESVRSERLMWEAVEKFLYHFSSTIEIKNDSGEVDNILMGLIMILIHLEEKQAEELVPHHLQQRLVTLRQAHLDQDN